MVEVIMIFKKEVIVKLSGIEISWGYMVVLGFLVLLVKLGVLIMRVNMLLK